MSNVAAVNTEGKYKNDNTRIIYVSRGIKEKVIKKKR
jgi:hypothetical protein